VHSNKNSILYLDWPALGRQFVIDAFKKHGYDVEAFPFSLEMADQTEKGAQDQFTQALIKKLKNGRFDFLFSQNFFTIPAVVCKSLGIVYVSWVYDSPFLKLYSDAVLYDTNLIFTFDSSDAETLKERGANAHYLPMAADCAYYSKLIAGKTVSELNKYRCDVSFVGSLYTGSLDSFDAIGQLEGTSDYLAGMVDGLIAAQSVVCSANVLEKGLSIEDALMINELTGLVENKKDPEYIRWIIANGYLARKATRNQRLAMLKLLVAMDGVDSRIYTDSEIGINKKADGSDFICPPLSYLNAAPLAFSQSSVNLNITLRSIKTGIPLRVFDILACHGFLLTNFQQDLMEHFELGKDIAVYYVEDEIKELIEFYLDNPILREQMKDCAYEKVRKHHNYDRRVDTILSKVRL